MWLEKIYFTLWASFYLQTEASGWSVDEFGYPHLLSRNTVLPPAWGTRIGWKMSQKYKRRLLHWNCGSMNVEEK